MDRKAKKIYAIGNSLVGLKAELAKKQEEPKSKKYENPADRPKSKKSEKVSLFSKKNEGVEKRSKRDLQLTVQETNDLEKSKEMLEKKVKLYEQMTETAIQMEDPSKLPFLVDFEQKAIDAVRNKRERQRVKECPKRKTDDDDDDDGDGEWVEYVDSLGRSRKCLKKDLPDLKEMDKKLGGNVSSQAAIRSDGDPELLSKDMRREMERQKWEEEKRQLSMKENVHYTDITFNETRDHGVGFFKFSHDEERRKQQMDLLKQLRQQTKIQRKQSLFKKKEKHEKIKNRLEKVKRRKVVQEALKISGIDLEDLFKLAEPITSEVGEESDMVADTNDEEKVDLLKRDDSWRKDAPIREWDLGKPTFGLDIGDPTIDGDKWLNERRAERMTEFAPPTTYLESSLTNRNTQSKVNTSTFSNDNKNRSDDKTIEDLVELNLKKLRMFNS